jgi:hypothetical protein
MRMTMPCPTHGAIIYEWLVDAQEEPAARTHHLYFSLNLAEAARRVWIELRSPPGWVAWSLSRITSERPWSGPC